MSNFHYFHWYSASDVFANVGEVILGRVSEQLEVVLVSEGSLHQLDVLHLHLVPELLGSDWRKNKLSNLNEILRKLLKYTNEEGPNYSLHRLDAFNKLPRIFWKHSRNFVETDWLELTFSRTSVAVFDGLLTGLIVQPGYGLVKPLILRYVLSPA